MLERWRGGCRDVGLRGTAVDDGGHDLGVLLDEWRNPLRVDVSVQDPSTFLGQLRQPIRCDDPEDDPGDVAD